MVKAYENHTQNIVHFHFIDENKKYSMANLESTIDSGVYDLTNDVDRKRLHEAFDNAINYVCYEDLEFPLDYDSIKEQLEESREDLDEKEIENIQGYIDEAKENEANIDNIHKSISSKNSDNIEQALSSLDILGYSLNIQPVETLYDKLIESGYPVSSSGISDSLYTINDIGEGVRISDHVRPSYGALKEFNHYYTNQLILNKDKRVIEEDLLGQKIFGVRIDRLDDVYLGNNGEDVNEIGQDIIENIKEYHNLKGNEAIEDLEELELSPLVIEELERERTEDNLPRVQPVFQLSDELEL